MLSGKTHEIRKIYDQNNMTNSPFGDTGTEVALELWQNLDFMGLRDLIAMYHMFILSVF